MRLSLMMAVVALATASQLQAQSNPQTRDGFTISFGFGGGSANTNCDGCSATSESSIGDYLRLGGAIRKDVVLAGQISAWSKSENGNTTAFGTVTFAAQWYPNPTEGWYLLGGVGGSSLQTSSVSGAVTTSVNGGAFGYELGTGYDWRVGKNFSLTPYVSYFGSSDIDLVGTTYAPHAVVLGLGFTWH